MHIVYGHCRVVTLKAALQPRVYLWTNTIYHPADAGLGIVLAVNLVKDISDLFLRKPLSIQDSSQPVTYFLLITKNSKSGDESCHNSHEEYGISISSLGHRRAQNDGHYLYFEGFHAENSCVLLSSCFQAWFPLGRVDHFLSLHAYARAQKFILSWSA